MMLRHLDETDAAERIEDAVLVTLEEGHSVTQDLARQTGGDVEQAASTTGFTDAIIANLDRQPTTVAPRRGSERPSGDARPHPHWSYGEAVSSSIARKTVGVDLFLETWEPAETAGPILEALAGDALTLQMISSRGTMVYPATGLAPDNVGLLRARFVARKAGAAATDADILALQARVAERYAWTHVEKLHVFGGEPGFTKAQGQ